MKFHVYIARGPNAASTMIEASDSKDALKQAATLWDEQRENINVHSVKNCTEMGCGEGYEKRRFA